MTSIVPSGSVSFWAEVGANHEHSLEYCDPIWNQKFNYQTEEGDFKFDNIECVRMPPEQAFFKGESEFYIPTYFRETSIESYLIDENTCKQRNCKPSVDCHIVAARGDNCTCFCKQSANFFVQQSEETKLTWDHRVEAGLGDKNVGARSDDPARSLLSIVRFQGKEVARFFEP